MLLVFILFSLLIIAFSPVTTIPLPIVFLVITTVIFKKSWVFFAALAIGLFLDLILIRPLGYTSLVFTVFVFLIWLYERKFETQTMTFVFLATFLGSLSYLLVLNYQNILLQSLMNAFLAVLFFRVILSKAKDPRLQMPGASATGGQVDSSSLYSSE